MRKFSVENNSYTEIDTESMRKYLNEISTIDKKLTDQQQKELIEQYCYNGDEKAKERLIEGNLRFVVSVAKQYNVSSVDFEDLVNEGNIGLQEAIERFNPEKGVKFISYAVWWVRRNIIMYLNEHSRSVKLPLNRITHIFKVEEAKEKLSQKYDREPTVSEIKGFMYENYDINENDVDEAIKFSGMKDESIEKPVKQNSEDTERTLLDIIPNENADDPEGSVHEEDEGRMTGVIFGNLERLERQVIDLYYGITTGVPLPLKEVGEEMGISAELVRQIRKGAEGKLKNTITDPRKTTYEQ